MADILSVKSFSWQMKEIFFRRRKWRIFISLLYVVSFIIYLLWRTTIINPNSLPLSLLYYFAELLSFILGLTLVFSLRSYSHRIPTVPKNDLKVDVFVPAYKEPLHIIRRTIIAAKNIDYNHKTFLLDDARREDLQKLAEELDIIYLRRDDNIGAKAGNINNGLKHSDADFVMVFDADHIAMPEALDIMLGFFDDENVAMVQTPQDYYNIDSFQHINCKKTGGLCNDQSSFYFLSQPCADSYNSSSCVGSGVIYRREALDAIGGIPCETITEDLHTAIKLHKLGYKNVFLNEPIAYGLAAGDINEYYKTRHRWGHGNLHALSLENILSCKGLSLNQRTHYLGFGLIHLEALQQLILLTVPSITLIFGLQPFTITIFNILVVLFFPIISSLFLQELGCGFSVVANEIFSMARWPASLKAFAGLWGKKIQFISSSKTTTGNIDFKIISPQLVVIFLNLFAVTFGIFKIYSADFSTGPLVAYIKSIFIEGPYRNINLDAVMAEGYTIELVVIAGFWALYNVLRGVRFVNKVLYSHKNNHEFCRFTIPFPILINNQFLGYTTSISEQSSDILLYDNTIKLKADDIVSAELFIPSGKINLKLDISDIKNKNNLIQISGKFIWSEDVTVRDILANDLYSVDWHREFLHRNAYFTTPSDWILKLLGITVLPKETVKREYKAVLIECEDKREYGVIFSYKDKADSTFLITFKQLNIGENYNIQVFDKKNLQKNSISILEKEPLSSLINKGLNKTMTYKYKVKM